MSIKATTILYVVKYLYNHGFRELLVEFVDDPDKSWDDLLVKGLDDMLGYKIKKD